MRVAAKDPDEYVASVPEERRAHLQRIRELVKSAVPDADERILWGMIGYEIHGRPFAAVASQKASMSLYLMDLATHPELRKEHALALKKLPMGKSCLRFRRVDELPLDVIAKILERAPSIKVDGGALASTDVARAKAATRPKRAPADVVELRPRGATPKKLALVTPAAKKPDAKNKKPGRKPT